MSEPLTTEEIRQVLEIDDSDDDGAIDHLMEETDDESDLEYELQSEEHPDDKELVSLIQEAQSHPRNIKGPKPSSGPPPKKMKSMSHTALTDQRPTSSSTVQSSNQGDSSEANGRILSWDTSIEIGKNGYEWYTDPKHNSNFQTRTKNVVRISPGPTHNARSANTALECFRVFFTDNIIDIILESTNREISDLQSRFKTQNSTLAPLTKEELLALFGSLFYAAAMKNNHLSAEVLHNTVYCGDKHVAIMSECRFKFLIRCLRFDDRSTRENRNTKLAPISEIWEMFVENCRKNYKPGSYLTIDEQLVGFRGNCPFRMYIPSKPNKYGMKIMMVCDNATKYMLNAIPYLGKHSNPTSEPAGTYYTLKLTEPFAGSNRNLTMDNWFTSIPLAERLLNDHKLTMIGTIRKDKCELPPDFVNLKYQGRKINTSLFLFSENVTAVSYKATEKKMATLISTLHGDGTINPGNGKPEIVLNYNETKGGVDVLDRLCHDTNTGRKTRRWPVAFFYNMLNISGVNSYVVFLQNFYRNHRSLSDGGSPKPMSRFKFFMQLVDDLSGPWMAHRLTLRIPSTLRCSITRCQGSDNENTGDPLIQQNENLMNGQQEMNAHREPKTRDYCSFCHYKKRRKTQWKCSDCDRSICGEHIAFQPKKCLECVTRNTQ